MEEPTTKEFGGDTLDFQDICLKDKKGKVWVAMWGKMVSPYQVGNLLKITKCKVKLFNGQKKLSTTQSSTSEIISHDDELEDLSSDEEEIEEGDQPVDSNNSILEPATITAIFDMDHYLSCPQRGCNNTKLYTVENDGRYQMKCKTCKGIYSASVCNNYVQATVLLEKSSGKTEKVAMFQPQIKKIFENRGVEFIKRINGTIFRTCTSTIEMQGIEQHY